MGDKIPAVWALWLAIAGLVTTAAAPLIHHFLGGSRESAAWRRDAKLSVYADALAEAQLQADWAEWAMWPLESPPGHRADDAPSVQTIAARLRLLAPPHVSEQWRQLLKAVQAFDWEVAESHGHFHQSGPNDGMAKDDPVRVALAEAAEAFARSVTDDFGGR